MAHFVGKPLTSHHCLRHALPDFRGEVTLITSDWCPSKLIPEISKMVVSDVPSLDLDVSEKFTKFTPPKRYFFICNDPRVGFSQLRLDGLP